MKKKVLWIILGILIFIGIIFGIIYFTGGLQGAIDFGDPNSFYKDTDTIKYQYTGESILNPETCSSYDISSYNIFFGNEKIINTGKSEFKFVISNPSYSYDVYGSFVTRMRYDVNIYKDGKLIDTISGVPTQEIGTCSPNLRREQQFYRAYSDDGIVYIPQGDEITPIVYKNNPVESGCPEGTYDTRYSNYNDIKEVKLPEEKTGINAVFKFDEYFGTQCKGKRGVLINKYEIISEEELIPIVDNTKIEEELIPLVDNTKIEEELIIENKSVIDKIFKITPEQKEIVIMVNGKEQTIQTKNNYNRLIIFIGIIVFIIILILILTLFPKKSLSSNL